jgi:hypothetical protein
MAPDEHNNLKNTDAGPAKKDWKTMTLAYVGEAKDVVQGGSGKITATGGDPGDTRKPSGGGH